MPRLLSWLPGSTLFGMPASSRMRWMADARSNSIRARTSFCAGSTQFCTRSPVWVANAILRSSALSAIQLTSCAYTSG